MNPEAILIRPVITEKASRLATMGQYVFEVATHATKIEVAAAVTRLFKVKVASVRTINYDGKRKVRHQRVIRRAAFKRAIVTLVKGQQLDVTAGAA